MRRDFSLSFCIVNALNQFASIFDAKLLQTLWKVRLVGFRWRSAWRRGRSFSAVAPRSAGIPSVR